MLVSNGAAGSIIGKAGTTINDFQTRTFARIQLSKSQEFYPGTQDRTLLVSGRLKQVVAALGLTLDKLLREGVAALVDAPAVRGSPSSGELNGDERPLHRSASGEGAAEPAAACDGEGAACDAAGAELAEGHSAAQQAKKAPHVVLKMLVPQPLCGIIIGKNGTTVRAISRSTGTSICVLQGDPPSQMLAHRVVTVTGPCPGILRAVALLVLKQADDPQFQLFSELPSAFAASPASVMPPPPYYAGAHGSPSGAYHLGAYSGAAGHNGYYGPAPSYGPPPPPPAAYDWEGVTSRRSSSSSGRGRPSQNASSSASSTPRSPGGGPRRPFRPFSRTQLTITQEQASLLSSGGYTLLNSIASGSGARLRLEHGIHHVPGRPGRLRVLTMSGAPASLHQAYARLAAHVGPAFAFGAPTQTPGFAFPIHGTEYGGVTHYSYAGPIAAHTVAGCTYYHSPAHGGAPYFPAPGSFGPPAWAPAPGASASGSEPSSADEPSDDGRD